jgi:hypothetical protein
VPRLLLLHLSLLSGWLLGLSSRLSEAALLFFSLSLLLSLDWRSFIRGGFLEWHHFFYLFGGEYCWQKMTNALSTRRKWRRSSVDDE